MMITEISKGEYFNGKQTGKYTLCLGTEPGRRYYELILSDESVIAIVSEGISEPKFGNFTKAEYVFFDKSVCWIMGKQVIAKTLLSAPVFEIVQADTKFIVLGEIDIVILDNELNEERRVELRDILTEYQVGKCFITYKTLEDTKGRILL